MKTPIRSDFIRADLATVSTCNIRTCDQWAGYIHSISRKPICRSCKEKYEEIQEQYSWLPAGEYHYLWDDQGNLMFKQTKDLSPGDQIVSTNKTGYYATTEPLPVGVCKYIHERYLEAGGELDPDEVHFKFIQDILMDTKLWIDIND